MPNSSQPAYPSSRCLVDITDAARCSTRGWLSQQSRIIPDRMVGALWFSSAVPEVEKSNNVPRYPENPPDQKVRVEIKAMFQVPRTWMYCWKRFNDLQSPKLWLVAKVNCCICNYHTPTLLNIKTCNHHKFYWSGLDHGICLFPLSLTKSVPANLVTFISPFWHCQQFNHANYIIQEGCTSSTEILPSLVQNESCKWKNLPDLT